MELHELTRLIRSKNAGPFMLTFDIIFADPEGYERVTAAGVVSPGRISALYGVPQDKVAVYFCEAAQAIKISFPRPVTSGDPDDPDVFGCQQHAPLVHLAV